MGKFANIVTLFNLALGMAAIRMAALGRPSDAAIFLILAAIMDVLDGKAASLEKRTEFGRQLDSLSDIVSFGTAPAALFMSLLPPELFFLPIILVIAGAWRLARYNTTNQKKEFIGLPITFNGIFVPALIYLGWTSPFAIGAYCVIMSSLMMSRIKVKRII